MQPAIRRRRRFDREIARPRLTRRGISASHPAQAPSKDAGHHVSDPDDVAAVRAAVLVPVLLRVQRQFRPQYAGHAHSLPLRRRRTPASKSCSRRSFSSCPRSRFRRSAARSPIRTTRRSIAGRLKFAEIFVQMIAAAGFVFSSPALLYVALFGLGIIAALFGPIKYGVLPDHLRREELVSGNALVEGATFAAIICGLVFGGLAAAQGRSAAGVVAQLMLVALACYGSARLIPPTGVGAPGLKVHKNVLASTWTVIREVRADDRQWVGAIGTSWFWMVGAVTLSLVPVIIKQRDRRRHRRRDRGQSPVRDRHRRWLAWRSAALSRAHRARARPVPVAGDGGAGDRHGDFDRGDADRERRNSARPILHQRRGPARRARDPPLFGRRRPVRRSDLRRGSGLGRRGPPRARRRRGQRAQLHLDGRRVARDHGPPCRSSA